MLRDVIMPTLGATMTSGTILRWLKQEGESVEQGEPIAEIETDKVVATVESFHSGILKKIIAGAGQVVPVGEVIAYLGNESDAIPDETPAMATSSPPPVAQPSPAAVVAQAEGPARVIASPLARKLAREGGLDLAEVRGCGAGGRIVAADVKTALAQKAARRQPMPRVEQGRPASPATPEVAAIAGIRGVIARRMAESHRTTAPVTLMTEVDVTEFIRLREAFKVEAERQNKPSASYTDLLIKIVAIALRDHPDLNTKLVGDEIHRLPEINIGVAADTERGLLVPVVREADRKPILQIAVETKELIQRARTGASLPDDLTGGTFTITNLGMFGIDAFTPIINLPECAILGVGCIKRKPVVRGDEIVISPMLSMSLTFDHRLVDGAPAARFLQRIAQLIEKPYLLLA